MKTIRDKIQEFWDSDLCVDILSVFFGVIVIISILILLAKIFGG